MKTTPRDSFIRLLLILCLLCVLPGVSVRADEIIIDHSCTDLSRVPIEYINRAKARLHIAYGHTSHGSQIITGMTGLSKWKGDAFSFRSGGGSGALDLRSRVMRGANDLGNPDRRSWEKATRDYLKANRDVNVVMWSWCGQAATSVENIDVYLDLMEGLIRDYRKVRFIFMTGHLDGSGPKGRLHQANERIRKHCREKGRTLFDFADIESFDPDGKGYLDKLGSDGCEYDSDGDGRRDSNWAKDWQSGHREGVDWFQCSSAHSQPLVANMKAYAAWWMWARLAGWRGPR